jgi:hypothetical protein
MAGIGMSLPALNAKSARTAEVEEGVLKREFEARVLYGAFRRSVNGVLLYGAIRDKAGLLRDFRILMVNPAGEKLLGMSAVDLVGWSWKERFPEAASD